jgi:hypothetical protein
MYVMMPLCLFHSSLFHSYKTLISILDPDVSWYLLLWNMLLWLVCKMSICKVLNDGHGPLNTSFKEGPWTFWMTITHKALNLGSYILKFIWLFANCWMMVTVCWTPRSMCDLEINESLYQIKYLFWGPVVLICCSL